MTGNGSERGNLRHEQAAATRGLLLAAACDVFEDRGYKATTVGAITDRAETAHGTFYLYFRNKEDAFCRVVEAVIADELVVGDIVPRGPAARTAIEDGVRSFVGLYERHAGLWRALLEGMLQSPRVRQVWLDLRRELVDRLAGALAAQQQAGAMRTFDAAAVSHALSAMTEWSAFTHLVLGEPPVGEGSPEALVATLTDLWVRALYGVLPEARGSDAAERLDGRQDERGDEERRP
ncbi:MAG TPA: helix-turn-helix domain-containing protein [Acidimicrobiales bacterium]|nr:helix-turn-helix domain-containing protein [Acidimicrobiales bacterium]